MSIYVGSNLIVPNWKQGVCYYHEDNSSTTLPDTSNSWLNLRSSSFDFTLPTGLYLIKSQLDIYPRAETGYNPSGRQYRIGLFDKNIDNFVLPQSGFLEEYVPKKDATNWQSSYYHHVMIGTVYNNSDVDISYSIMPKLVCWNDYTPKSCNLWIFAIYLISTDYIIDTITY